MQVSIKKIVVAVPVVAAFFILSCSNNPAGNSIKENLSSQESADLAKMAQTITSVMSINKTDDALNGLGKKRSTIFNTGCTTVSTGMEVCTSMTDDEVFIDSTWNYSDENRTVPTDPNEVPAGQYIYSKNHLIMRDATTESIQFSESKTKQIDNMAFLSDLEDPDALTNYFKAMESSEKCWGTMNYYNDDLMLDFYDVSFTIKNGRITGDYNFKIMDGKYNVKISFNLDMTTLLTDELEDTSQKTEMFRGPISNSANEQIGVFVVYYDESVEIFDNNGLSLKKAG